MDTDRLTPSQVEAMKIESRKSTNPKEWGVSGSAPCTPSFSLQKHVLKKIRANKMTTTNKTPKEESQNSITTEPSPEGETNTLQRELHSFQNGPSCSWGWSIPREIYRLISSSAATESILLDVMRDNYHVWIKRAALRSPNVTEAVLMELAQEGIRDIDGDWITPSMILSHSQCTPLVKTTVERITPPHVMRVILMK